MSYSSYIGVGRQKVGSVSMVGKIVMKTAAVEYLTPVKLELGGKR